MRAATNFGCRQLSGFGTDYQCALAAYWVYWVCNIHPRFNASLENN